MPIANPARVGVVVHVFFPELLDDIVGRLAAIPVPFDLIVTNASGATIRIDKRRLPRASSVLVLDVENRGRDLWPLAQLVNAGLLDPYEIVLKVHTKRSGWRDRHSRLPGTGASWRDDLLNALLSDGPAVIGILDAFAVTPSLGLVTADGSLLGPEFWGDNQAVTASLLRRLELELRPDELTFAAGSMYWARGFVLQGLRALSLTAADFEDEAGQVNATTAHALERLIGMVTHEAGLSVTSDPDSRLDPRRRRLEAFSAHRQAPAAGTSHSVLPSAVPSDSGERPVVGRGLHGVDERRCRPTGLPRPPPAEAAHDDRVLRPSPR